MTKSEVPIKLKTLKASNKTSGFAMSFTSYTENILKSFILDSCKNGNTDYCY